MCVCVWGGGGGGGGGRSNNNLSKYQLNQWNIPKLDMCIDILFGIAYRQISSIFICVPHSTGRVLLIHIFISGMGLDCQYLKPMLNILEGLSHWKQCRDLEQMYTCVYGILITKNMKVSGFRLPVFQFTVIPFDC